MVFKLNRPLVTLLVLLLAAIALLSAGSAALGKPAAQGTLSAGNNWAIETVDDERQVDWLTAMALDPQGYPHIAYGSGSNLRISRWSGSDWHSDVVEMNAGWGSLAVDASGLDHVSYLDMANLELKYAQWTGSDWSIQTVDDAGEVGYGSSIALDQDGKAHIVYIAILDDRNMAVKYAHWTGRNWAVEEIETLSYSDLTLFSMTITTDGDNKPHVAYQIVWLDLVDAYGRVMYATPNRDDWTIERVDDSIAPNDGGDASIDLSIAADADGAIHLSYFKINDWSGWLTYAKRTAGTWRRDYLDTNTQGGGDTSLVLDGEGQVHIAYRPNYFDGPLNYARQMGDQWFIEEIEEAAQTWRNVALALDGDGRPLISYINSNPRDLMLARFQSGNVYLPLLVKE